MVKHAEVYTQLSCIISLDRIYLINPSLHLVFNNCHQSLSSKAAFKIDIIYILTINKRYIKRQQCAKDLAVLADPIPVKYKLVYFLNV